jgi:uncharacterized tellurite resistance protein B-like protein
METTLRARLRRWFSEPSEAMAGNEDIDLSLAALLVEVMRADYEDDPREYETIRRLLAQHFDLDEKSASALLEEGEQAANHAVSLFKHTRALDVGLEEKEKFSVIEALWKLAFADGTLAGEEDYLVHKIGDLVHVRHSDIMRLKDKVARARSRREQAPRTPPK